MQELTKGKNLEVLEEKAKLAKEAEILLGTIPQSVFKRLLEQQISKLTGVLPQETAATSQRVSKVETESTSRPQEQWPKALGYLFALIISQPNMAKLSSISIPEELKDIEGMDVLVGLLNYIDRHDIRSQGALLEYFRGHPLKSYFSGLIHESLDHDDIESFRLDISETFQTLKAQQIKRTIENLLAKKILSDSEKVQLKKYITDASTL
nr:hypothetical protein [Methylomarinum sp. Ch1-1]MDP4518970.1 hypothetical protein [Methylomarinum sp. Ch1-1]MDP4523368.1 hypothetical protein [Methylomarinum sp. Ch1-1]